MFGLGIGELVVILIVAILFVGPDKLPKLARTVGDGIRSLRRHSDDLRQTIERDSSIGPSVRELKDALSGMPSALRPDDDEGSDDNESEPKAGHKLKDKSDDDPRNG